MIDNDNTPPASNAAKRLARLVAVQALYQASYGEEPLSAIIKRCLDEAHAILNGEEGEAEIIHERPDPELLRAIVSGVEEHRATLEEMLSGALDPKFSAGRMEILLRTILLAGAFELHHHASIPHKVIISDYIDVSRAFFNAKEPGLVNAVLDKLAQKLRA